MKLRKLNNVTGNKITLDPWLLNFQLASDWLTDSLIWKAVVASVSLLEQNFGTKLKFFFPGRRAEKKKHMLGENTSTFGQCHLGSYKIALKKKDAFQSSKLGG